MAPAGQIPRASAELGAPTSELHVAMQDSCKQSGTDAPRTDRRRRAALDLDRHHARSLDHPGERGGGHATPTEHAHTRNRDRAGLLPTGHNTAHSSASLHSSKFPKAG